MGVAAARSVVTIFSSRCKLASTELEGAAQTQIIPAIPTHILCGELDLWRGTERRRVRTEDSRNDNTCFNLLGGHDPSLAKGSRLETRTYTRTLNSNRRQIVVLRDVWVGQQVLLWHGGSDRGVS